jgi:hypothetical protein
MLCLSGFASDCFIRLFVLCLVVPGILLVGGGCKHTAVASFATDAGSPASSHGDLSPAPWTNLDFANEPDDFRFAIVADRCGGERPGVFLDALNKLSLLRPEFVMAVGDLIEGYSEDEAVVQGMWQELTDMVSRLQMPFFKVPGNHDVTNPTQDIVWDRLFGNRYYWFEYKGVLFLCLNSQDNDSRQGLSPAQVAWAQDVLAQHADARWTFVFMHKPLWVYEEGDTETSRKTIKDKKDTGFGAIESALAGRNYTVFAGHFHQYAKFIRNGQRYYILASTGGGSSLSGPEHGEFDHVVWISMQPDGPSVVNLELDGILRDDIFTEKHLLAARDIKFQDAPPTKGAPAMSMTLPFVWTNPFPQTVSMELTWANGSGPAWTVTPLSVAEELAPGGVIECEFEAAASRSDSGIVPMPVMRASLTGSNRLSLEKTIALPFDAKSYFLDRLPEIQCQKVDGAVKVDGLLDDQAWRRSPDTTNMTVRTLDGNPSVATGFWVSHDTENLYVAARCSEPNLPGLVTTATERDGHCWEDDSVEIFVATDEDRKMYYQFIVTASGVLYDGKIRDSQWNGECAWATGREEAAWTLEMAIPWKTIGLTPPASNSRLGLELVRTRVQSGREMLQWAPSPDDNHNTTLFGYLCFD